MNTIKVHKPFVRIWNNFKINSMKELKDIFQPVFKEDHPTLSNKSFNYHFTNYIDNIMKDETESYILCDTIEDEIERFKWYLNKIYNI